MVTNFFDKENNEGYVVQIGVMVVITLIISLYTLKQFGYDWTKTLIYSYIIIHIMYIIMGTNHIISAVFLNSLTYILNIPVLGQIVGYIGVFGMLLISPIYLLFYSFLEIFQIVNLNFLGLNRQFIK